jgi:hypothetical protein
MSDKAPWPLFMPEEWHRMEAAHERIMNVAAIGIGDLWIDCERRWAETEEPFPYAVFARTLGKLVDRARDAGVSDDRIGCELKEWLDELVRCGANIDGGA